MTLTFDIQPSTLKALLTIAATGDIRYYLNSVAIDVRGDDVTLVATDGHVLLALPITEFERGAERVNQTYIIDRAALESVKAMKAGRIEFPIKIKITVPEPTPDPERNGVMINYPATFTIQGATTATGTVVDGRYPDWRRVMPATANKESAQFNPEFITRFGKVAKLMGEKTPYIHHNGAGAALVTGLGSALGVIMPLRGDESHPGLPAWATHRS